MLNDSFQLILFLVISVFIGCRAALSESELKGYLENTFEKEASDLCYQSNIAEFAYATDIKNKQKEEVTVSFPYNMRTNKSPSFDLTSRLL